MKPEQTKEIELSQNKVALVDDGDYEWLNQWKWHASKSGNNFYAVKTSPRINNKQTRTLMHRMVLELAKGDGIEVDHINRNGLDNRKSNLRIVKHSVNCQNHSGYSHNSSGNNGVSWDKLCNKWRAYIRLNNKFIHLGLFKDIGDAINAREQGEQEYWK